MTLPNYLRLKEGMSYAEAVRLLGKGGADTGSGPEHSLLGAKAVQYLWRG